MATENQETKSRRDALNERLLGRYPDLDVNDDEAVSGRISDDYDDYDRQLSEYKEREGRIVDMFNADPRSANAWVAMENGTNPLIAMMRTFGPSFKEALDDPELLGQLEEEQKQYLDRVAKNKELEAEFEQNDKQTLEDFDAFKKRHGLSPEEAEPIITMLGEIIDNGLRGKITPETMELAYKAINHDEDVATAAEDAEVKGRNAKINETLRKRNEGDGVAALDGANNPPQQNRRPNIFDYAEAAK